MVVAKDIAVEEKSPSGISIIWRELVRDKIAFISFLLVVILASAVYITSAILDQAEIVRVDLFAMYEPPSAEYWLGTDYGGRDVFGQLIIGTANSLQVGVFVTLLSGTVGVLVGLIAGYFGNWTDNILMRILDFFQSLPSLMIIIVAVTIVSSYDVFSFSLIMSTFLWMHITRIIRAKVMQESAQEYIHAARTLGSSHVKIMFYHLLPNVMSLIIVTMTLNLAANIGIESGLSFLGFGFPESTPSLGTLVSYARNPQVLEYRPWIWLPASLLIFVLMLCINNVGQALKRATDAKQRRG
ncbi:ABC transporter permease [Alkalicoccobacillus porphyridii]|uniref:ABC transporter permease n=1 Tax=Alkalicoccobacillus porphyridii TaxID=2597270 RepID=A0A554A3W3_9BACI|nr:ABC transporter permease [Alkalicoccobacillus porphyridii]TSB48358.1 ABC transporter permease [Alkalicoccobacillus porphyridii]